MILFSEETRSTSLYLAADKEQPGFKLALGSNPPTVDRAFSNESDRQNVALPDTPLARCGPPCGDGALCEDHEDDSLPAAAAPAGQCTSLSGLKSGTGLPPDGRARGEVRRHLRPIPRSQLLQRDALPSDRRGAGAEQHPAAGQVA